MRLREPPLARRQHAAEELQRLESWLRRRPSDLVMSAEVDSPKVSGAADPKVRPSDPPPPPGGLRRAPHKWSHAGSNILRAAAVDWVAARHRGDRQPEGLGGELGLTEHMKAGGETL